MSEQKAHTARIIEQFTQQAIPFTELPGHYDAIERLLEMAQVSANDRVLDIACGPGLVSCAFARRAQHVTGIDLTPAMLDQARQRQAKESLNNLSWQCADALALPFPEAHFSCVITRYSFHHLLAPAAALREMIRVCQPGGRILVADVAMPDAQSAAYDALELLRDPSHTHALSHSEWTELFAHAGLENLQYSDYEVPLELEAQLRASFPVEGGAERIRQWLTNDVGRNDLGIQAHWQDGALHYRVPIRIYTGTKSHC